MGHLLIIIGSIFILMVINANLIKLYLDEKTRYKNIDIYDQPIILFFYMFFGVFILPFMKYMKRYRKILYLKKRLNDLRNRSYVIYKNPTLTDEKINNEIFSIKRILKIERIKRKTNEIF